MDWTLHNGITEDPNSTLPNGQAETAVKDVLLFKVPLRDIWNQLAFKAYRKKYNDIKNREIALRDEKGHLFLLIL